VGVGVIVGVSVIVAVNVIVGVRVRVAVDVDVGVSVAVGVAVGVGVSVANNAIGTAPQLVIARAADANRAEIAHPCRSLILTTRLSLPPSPQAFYRPPFYGSPVCMDTRP
jgi:hypothetical protein